MSFDETLYAGDDEMDEFGESGAYGDSLEEDYEDEEEEEEAEMPGGESRPEPEPTPASQSGGGGGGPKPARKAPKKKPAKSGNSPRIRWATEMSLSTTSMPAAAAKVRTMGRKECVAR